jgi:hypothetical protein
MMNDSRRPHKEVQVKVNALVDEGIAALVIALNSIDGVITLDSCEEDAGTGEASVYFTYGIDWRELEVLVGAIARSVRSLNLCCGFCVSVEWFGSNDQPRAHLSLRREHVADVARVISPEGLTPERPRQLVATGTEGLAV